MESQLETQPESIEEPPLETPKERKREPQVESEKEVRADRGKDVRSEPQMETQPESHKGTPKETPKEPETDAQAESEREARADRGTDVRYESIEDIPDSLRSTLPREAQEVYLQAYQESWDTYEEHQGGELGRAAVAHRDGWNVMSKQYAKHPASGKWYAIDELPEDEEHEDDDEGLVGKIKNIF
jgi:cation transport regulator